MFKLIVLLTLLFSGSAWSACELVKPSELCLQWTPPVARADGAALSPDEIAGYRIKYGTQTLKYTKVVDVNTPLAVSKTIQNVPAGEYYIVMQTVDKNGLVSINSVEIKKSVSGTVVVPPNPDVTAKPNPPANLTATVWSAESDPENNENGGSETPHPSETENTGEPNTGESTTGFNHITRSEFQKLSRPEQVKYSQSWRAAGKPNPFFKADSE